MNSKAEKLAKKASRRAAKTFAHKDALERIAVKDIDIQTFIDVGAAQGGWSLLAEQRWPKARYHLLEAKDEWRLDLQKLAAQKENYSFTLKAVSDRPGVIYFPKGGDMYGGAAFKKGNARDSLEEVPATSIDQEVEDHSLKGPFAIKLDTHGTEVDILEGAAQTLKDTSLICIETYNFIGQKRFPEMLVYLQSKGFRTADVAGPLFRSSDASFWQIDFYLLRADHPVFQNHSFS